MGGLEEPEGSGSFVCHDRKSQIEHPLPDRLAQPDIRAAFSRESLGYFRAAPMIVESSDGVVRGLAVTKYGPIRPDYGDPGQRMTAQGASHHLELDGVVFRGASRALKNGL